MNTSINDIPLVNLATLALLVVPVILVLFRWKLEAGKSIYAMSRMLLQLLAIGYVLAFIFEASSAALVLAVLAIMVAAATWISLNPLKKRSRPLYLAAFVAILISGLFSLVVVTQGVLRISPWYNPRLMIPLAGMIFSSAMTAISLSSDRIVAELERGADYSEARATAFHAALIPSLNALFAVGLVSLPGMMTGQILSGVTPLIAVKYQIVVMVMLFSSVGLSTAIFLTLSRKHIQLLFGTRPAS